MERLTNKQMEKVLFGVYQPKIMPKWGAWVGACLEFLQEDGYVTRDNTITDRGRKYCEKFLKDFKDDAFNELIRLGQEQENE